MSVEENKAIVHRFYDAWNRGDMQAAYDLFADDVIDHNPTPGLPDGKQGMIQSLDAFTRAFSGSRLTLVHLFTDGDAVIDHSTFRGTHNGPLFGIPPSGKTVEITSTNIYRFKNGKISELYHVEDIFGLMQQIGAIPGASQAHAQPSTPARRVETGASANP